MCAQIKTNLTLVIFKRSTFKEVAWRFPERQDYYVVLAHRLLSGHMAQFASYQNHTLLMLV